ncbi:hypothetical protein APB71_34555 [Pseudomonas aeruginosa]|uniref:hypothetical protein n=1 Tax=Pseudomonas aeruginosa TaxID=287 RepID=UPI0008FBB3AF|nr:hypothetical protein [Pseudomonas aeruginosa]OPE43443.1 hypothetical protein APB71_34555 [Pseudomonas aeruginosa]
MHLPTTRTLPYQPSANPAGTPARLPRKHSHWLELEPLSLPLELAFWALWHRPAACMPFRDAAVAGAPL